MESTRVSSHTYLRRHRLPHIWCAGCGNGIVLGSVLRAMQIAAWDRRRTVVVSGIGCAGRMSTYCDFDTLHTTHGRALAFATGLKLAKPSLEIAAIMGEGDCLAIGGSHLIHAARRNLDVTAIMINNWIYGMTGGQTSPTTPQGKLTSTAPGGQRERNLEATQLARVCGAAFVARGATCHVQQLDRLLAMGMGVGGFSFIEVLSQCPTRFGRLNGFNSGVQMLEWQREHVVSVKRAQVLKALGKALPTDAIVTGVLSRC